MFPLLFIIASFHFFFLNPIRGFKYNNHHLLGRLTPRFIFVLLHWNHYSFYELPTLLIHRMMAAPDIDLLAGLDSVTKSIGNLGATAPLALAVFLYTQQDKKFESAINASSMLLRKDITATNDLLSKDITATNDLLSKDIKALSKDITATNDLLSKNIKATSDLLSKDIIANSVEIKATNDLLSKDIQSTNKNIDKLSQVIMDFTKKKS